MHQPYPIDLTPDQWDLLASLLPPPNNPVIHCLEIYRLDQIT